MCVRTHKHNTYRSYISMSGTRISMEKLNNMMFAKSMPIAC